jgi:hypothetical protein
MFRDGSSVDMVSPIEGSVADINEAAVRDPRLTHKDPYGEGWLLTVQSPDTKPTSATCWVGHWPAGGRKSLRAICREKCRWHLEHWRRRGAWPWTISQRKCPTRTGRC